MQRVTRTSDLARRTADWFYDRLPRVDPSSTHVDWFYVWLAGGPCLAALIVGCIYLVDLLCNTSILPHSVATPHTLKAYAAAHALSDKQINIIGLVAAAYPALIWIILKVLSRARQL